MRRFDDDDPISERDRRADGRIMAAMIALLLVLGGAAVVAEVRPDLVEGLAQ
jgi:hypothetical protein